MEATITLRRILDMVRQVAGILKTGLNFVNHPIAKAVPGRLVGGVD